jgi:uncharacterized protein (TIRG00374 family)
MATGVRPSRGKKLLSLGLLALGLGVLGWTARQVDLAQAGRELGRVGWWGAALFLLNIALTIGGPFLGWHLLMRSLGIPVGLGTTLLSGLVGRAANLLSPMSYFGGEGVRTFHIAAMTGVPRRRVLAAVAVSEFQVMAGLTVFTLVGLALAAAGKSLSGPRLVWALAGGGGLAVLLLGLLGMALGDLKPCLRIIDALVRRGIFPQRLGALRSATLELETLIRSLFVEKKLTFFLAQALSLSSPVAQFFRPTLYFWLIGRTGLAASLPSFSELTVFFVLSQLVFMLPTTPGGVGVYEAGVVGLFRFLGWDVADGAAYGLLLRLDDVVYISAALGAMGAYSLGWIRPPQPPPGGDHDGPSATNPAAGAPGAPALPGIPRVAPPGLPPPSPRIPVNG